MKTVIISLVLALTTLLFSCSNSASDVTSTNSQIVSSGNWRVSSFIDSGNDETQDFSGYSFVFNTNGVITATKNSSSQNGTWTIDNSSNKFHIDLGPKTTANHPLGELTDDWKIVSSSNTEIRLTDDNPTSSEFVTFTKN
jgi:hypothetical protein